MPILAQYLPESNFQISAANAVKSSIASDPQSSTSVKITNNKIAASKQVSFPSATSANGITINGVSQENSAGCIIQGNSIYSDYDPYTDGISIGSAIKNIIISNNDISGFSENGIRLKQSDGYVGSVVNNFIKRKDSQEISSFICGARPNTCTALVTNNFFSHDTVDGISNWADVVKNRGYWTVETNKNQIEEIKINGANGNYFTTNSTVSISDDGYLIIANSLGASNAVPTSATSENNVRISLLDSDGLPIKLFYDNSNPASGSYIVTKFYDHNQDPVKEVLMEIPNFSDTNGRRSPVFQAIDNAFGKVEIGIDGNIYVTSIGTTYTNPFLTYVTNDFPAASTIDSNFPVVTSYNWLGNSVTAPILIKFLKDNKNDIFVKITGSNSGFNGRFKIKDIDDVNKMIKIDSSKNYDFASPQTEPSDFTWAINLYDLIGNNRVIKGGSLTLKTSNASGNISIYLNKNKIGSGAIDNNEITFTLPQNFTLNNSDTNIRIISSDLDGSVGLKIDLIYKW